MPTYGYRCENGHEFEVYQSMSEPPLERCQECGAPVRRIFYPVGIVFKGPGFYKTDSRGSSSSTTPASAASDSKSTTEKSESGTEKSESGKGKSESSTETPGPGTKPARKAEKKESSRSEGKPAAGSGEKKSA